MERVLWSCWDHMMARARGNVKGLCLFEGCVYMRFFVYLRFVNNLFCFCRGRNRICLFSIKHFFSLLIVYVIYIHIYRE